MSYHINARDAAEQSADFRRVLFTGTKSQLVIMNIPPGGEVGEETHDHVEQTLYIHTGAGEGMLNGETFPLAPGETIVVTPGTRHNFKNTGTEPMKIITTYSPPNHIDGRVHHTKADADADEEDEAFGHAQA